MTLVWTFLTLPYFDLHPTLRSNLLPARACGGQHLNLFRGGTIGFLNVCHSVRPSVCLSVHPVSVHSVFLTFLSRPLRYWPEIWYSDLSWHDTDQVRLLSRSTYFYWSYCPLQKFSFPNFSLSSFVILTWNMEYDLSWHDTDQVRLLSSLIHFYISYCPLLKFRFPDFSLSSFGMFTWNSYMNLSWRNSTNTSQVLILLYLTYF